MIVDKISNENKTEMMKDKLSKLKCGEQDARNWKLNGKVSDPENLWDKFAVFEFVIWLRYFYLSDRGQIVYRLQILIIRLQIIIDFK